MVERPVTAEFVNLETGELVQLHEGDYIRRAHVKDNYSERVSATSKKEPMYLHLAGSFTKAYDFGLQMLSQDSGITKTEYQMLFLLLPHIRENSGLCALKGGKEITLEWLASQMGIALLTARNVLMRLKQRGIVHYGSTAKTKTIYVNPYLFFNGRYISKSLEDMFKRTVYYTEYIKRVVKEKEKDNS